ncbi:hypothetical protein SYNPS1DRAFT_28009 [Syncephalis pseudoplumigaleata]|uniref:Uncharacterized protein n=1 Tax=Syncephalis pseudoplumigaleata TaxID=1712513 RepID=A0A4P9Z3C0_9FUNG|nr:hypothetical protein SYNPS1DRAFT_28009 [Syncephalis pseudoplumigaleata]|eukprot:RKP26291.1 hypothetical protein SYNPS1DRAFT_28009 [Syncephalis pseudoplumigaleata]
MRLSIASVVLLGSTLALAQSNFLPQKTSLMSKFKQLTHRYGRNCASDLAMLLPNRKPQSLAFTKLFQRDEIRTTVNAGVWNNAGSAFDCKAWVSTYDGEVRKYRQGLMECYLNYQAFRQRQGSFSPSQFSAADMKPTSENSRLPSTTEVPIPKSQAFYHCIFTPGDSSQPLQRSRTF